MLRRDRQSHLLILICWPAATVAKATERKLVNFMSIDSNDAQQVFKCKPHQSCTTPKVYV